ncbi:MULTISPECIES: hypothetical protein [unclassified Polaribacter]|jgi:hypothetical protein|uniref:hypothetical protein n=1 Tax=unclassified Polaribacter TaxID=196858 RepID=UPI00052C04DD|nr:MULTISPECIES: hypothetical protein [unclassified Polaribacter]KGL60721.1 hypothetical protein PHEL49_1613 [Polaribacter sp. Hel1_33_49]PKV64988.1 hypothetical protein ATE90_1396 [Polaribacter sp. Hel1_33_96]
MKKVVFFSLLLIFSFISCDKMEKNIPIYSHSLQTDSVAKFTLNSAEKEGFIIFEYRNQIDSLLNLDLKYNLEGNFLISDFDTFLATEKVYKAKRLAFQLYQNKEIKGHTRTLFFNTKYGLLSSITFGGDYLFLKDSIALNTKELIFKELFLNLNKINIKDF